MNGGIIVLFMIIGAVASAVIASNKNRNPGGWAVLGALFPLISILIVASLETLSPESQGGS